MQNMSLERHVEELRRTVQQLTPYSFPNGDIETETDLLPLKSRNIVVDGYDVSVTLSESDFDAYTLDSLQVQGVYTPFLPFYVVCKVAVAFLGDQGLAHTNFVKNNRKIYCWAVRRNGNKILRYDSKSHKEKYERLAYMVLKPGQLNLYETKD